MARSALIACAVLWGGCAHTVNLELEAAPSVAVVAESVAVVSRDRSCSPVANALIDELRDSGGPGVDPNAAVRIELVRCGTPSYALTVLEEVRAGGGVRRSAELDGRLHAVAVVYGGGHPQAHLIGATRHSSHGGWRTDGLGDLVQLRRAVERDMSDEVARDLAQQLLPVRTVVKRRVYPNANRGSARERLTLAVQAELVGDLDDALHHARAALDERPSERAAAYVRELERRSSR